MNEPEQAFPYKRPSDFIKNKYDYLFKLDSDVPLNILKLIFDKTISLVLIIFLGFPILIFLKILYLIEGLVKPSYAGPLIYYYYAVSQGKVFKKYKIRVIKPDCIDHLKAKEGKWEAYSSEWKTECRTFVGKFVKKFYLDEIPQLYSILKGDMSFVGPRPLSEIHYQRDLSQGNITRKYLRGGLLGLGHIMKGKAEFGDPIYEYIYLDYCFRKNILSLFILDLKIIFKGLIVVLKGKGL